MKFVFTILSLLLFYNFAFAGKVHLKQCSSRLSYDIYRGDCGGHGHHPCEAETVVLGDANFNLTFDQTTGSGEGSVVVTSVAGIQKNSNMQCRLSTDPYEREWMNCRSQNAVLENDHIEIALNIRGLNDANSVFFIQLFLDPFNAPNGSVNTRDNCKSTNIEN